MLPSELRRYAARLEAAGQKELAMRFRNRAAARELGVKRIDASPVTGASSINASRLDRPGRSSKRYPSI